MFVDPTALTAAGGVVLVLGVAYCILLLGSIARAWTHLRRASLLELPSLFVLSLVFLMLVRTVALLSLGIASAVWTDAQRSAVGQLYALATEALLSVGDAVFVSLYLLLLGLWVEALVAVRRHLLDLTELRACWLTAWLVVNSVFYGLQIALFVALFASNSKEDLLVTIHAIAALVSFALPLLVLAVWLVARAMLRGYPRVGSVRLAGRLQQLGLAVALWSVGRLAWGGLGVAEATSSQDVIAGQGGSWRFAVTVSAVFLVGELLPATQALLGIGVGSDDLLRRAPADDNDGVEAGITGGDGGVAGGRRGGDGGPPTAGIAATASSLSQPVSSPPGQAGFLGRAASAGAMPPTPGATEPAQSFPRGLQRRARQRAARGAWASMMSADPDTDDDDDDDDDEVRHLVRAASGRTARGGQSLVGWIASGAYGLVFGSRQQPDLDDRLLNDADAGSVLSLTGSVNGGAVVVMSSQAGPDVGATTTAGTEEDDGGSDNDSADEEEGVIGLTPLALAIRQDQRAGGVDEFAQL